MEYQLHEHVVYMLWHIMCVIFNFEVYLSFIIAIISFQGVKETTLHNAAFPVFCADDMRAFFFGI